MSREIPQRQPVGDPFHGTVLHVNRRFALATDTQDAPVAHQGDFVIRYGVRFLGKQHLAIVPGLLALDYGQMLTGEDAWTFMRENASRYPRADVVGYRHDGTDDMQPLKNLDFDVPFMVLVYADAGSAAPLASVEALITDATRAAELPPRLLKHLPRFDTISAWLEPQQ